MDDGRKSALRWVGWALAIVLFLGYSAVSIHKSRNDDFRAYYQAGKYVLSQDNIYDRTVVEGGYLYAPVFALCMVPLAVLPQGAAATLWYVANIFSLGFSLAMALYLVEGSTRPFPAWLRAHLGSRAPDRAPGLVLILVLVLSARFWLNTIEHGQVNLQLWAMVLAAVYLQRNNQQLLGSVLLSFAIATKVLPGLLLFYYLMKGRFWFVFLSVLFLLGFMAIPAMMLGWQHNLALLVAWYHKTLGPGLAQGGFGAGDSNQSVPAMLTRLFSVTRANEATGASVNLFSLGPDALGWLMRLSSALFVVVIMAAVIARRSSDVLVDNLQLSIVLLSAVLMPALAWKAYFVVAIMGYATLVHYLVTAPDRRRHRLTIGLLVLSFVLHSLTTDGIWGWRIAHVLQSYSCVTASMLVLYVALLRVLWSQGARAIPLPR